MAVRHRALLRAAQGGAAGPGARDGPAGVAHRTQALRRPTRADAPVVSWDAARRLVKVNPDGHVDRRRHRQLRGATTGCPSTRSWRGATCSIGCAPTTRPVAPARTPGPGAGRARTRPSAACTFDGHAIATTPPGWRSGATSAAMHFVTSLPRRSESSTRSSAGSSTATPSTSPTPSSSATAWRGPTAIATVAGEHERLKWVGLYPQRQGGDAFMMRVKVPGGVLSADQAREIGVVADAFGEGPDDSAVFGNRYADITTRQDIQIHWIRIGDVPRIWQRFADVGLTTVQACGDSARNVAVLPGRRRRRRGGVRRPARGQGHLGVLHRQPRVRKPAAEVQDERDGLHRGLRAGRDQRHRPVAGSDCRRHRRLQRARGRRPVRRRADGLGHRRLRAARPGGRAHPGGGPALRRARQSREPGLARMRYLVQELGPEAFRAELAARRASPSPRRAKSSPAATVATTWACTPERQPGLVSVGCSVPVGRMTGIELVEAARLARDLWRRLRAPGHRPELRAHRRARGPPRRPACARTCWPSTRPSPGPSSAVWWRARAVSSAGSPSSRRRSGP